MTIILLILVMLTIPAVLFRKPIDARWQRWQQARCERESFYFRQFVKSSRSSDPKAAFSSLMRWLDRIRSGAGAARKHRQKVSKTKKAMMILPPLNPNPAKPEMKTED